ncbi:MAG: DEAD/DEAH box helicase [Candidatus Melainabacteria bacterium]|nr:DEAD/DEAH box helicase [Candidatus Melainabacteria bacterium]
MNPIQAYEQYIPFPLDDFQREAIETIANGHSVVVCAPTGSGKTVIAEFAAFQAIEQGCKVFYTTPLKALSNQKFYDFKKQFGDANVGLLTGDMSHNRDARIVVMTTEVFRNMLYGLSEDSSLLSQVGYVVLDECHYMNDSDRGTVWEESIIYCPDTIQIIALSATIANAKELTAWINEVHHDTQLVSSDFRPVPLRFYYHNRGEIMPLFEGSSHKLNKRLRAARSGNRDPKHHRQFQTSQLIEEMYERDMLPAIVFVFSRKGCDKALFETRKLDLLTREERARLKAEVAQFLEQMPFLKDNEMIPLLENGFASHHAGLLPGLKMLVENLFQQGLIKAVFATETLAAGINMPARSTVITAISKRTDTGHRLLTASEFLQMSGRAGRRGMDEVGHVVVVHSQFNSAQEAATLASSPSDPLNSQFTPTYGMVLNLLQKWTLDDARFLMSKSFGAFTVQRRLAPILKDLAERKGQLAEVEGFACPASLNWDDFEQYLKWFDTYHDQSRQVGVLKKQIHQFGSHPEMLAVLKQQEAERSQLQNNMKAMACFTCDQFNRHRRADERRFKLHRQVHKLEETLEAEKNYYWQQFINIYKLLKEVGYVDEADRPTSDGLLCAELRTENELFLATLVNEGCLNDLRPEVLAATLAALVNDSFRENTYTSIKWSAESRKACQNLFREARRIERLQEKHGVSVPVNVITIPCGLVEAWALGLDWDGLMASTNLGEGDLVRTLRRTSDLLRQLSRIPSIPSELGSCARQAVALLYRDPIRELDVLEDGL